MVPTNGRTVKAVPHLPICKGAHGWISLNPNPTDGAALIYTSVKEEKNLDLLYKYILHKMYGFQLTSPALVVEKDAVFM